jgi:hypothetical protein
LHGYTDERLAGFIRDCAGDDGAAFEPDGDRLNLLSFDDRDVRAIFARPLRAVGHREIAFVSRRNPHASCCESEQQRSSIAIGDRVLDVGGISDDDAGHRRALDRPACRVVDDTHCD